MFLAEDRLLREPLKETKGSRMRSLYCHHASI